MLVLSFDAAIKSLGIALIEYKDIYADMQRAYDEYTTKLSNVNLEGKCVAMIELLEQWSDILDTRMTILYADVIDLIPAKKVKDSSPLEIARCLRKALTLVDKEVAHYMTDTSKLTVLIEYQMNANDKSRLIAAQLMYHYCIHNTLYIGPALKNKLHILSDAKSTHCTQLAKYKSTYTANKMHTRYLMYCIVDKLKCKHMIDKIKKARHKDIADAICMSLAWFMTTH